MDAVKSFLDLRRVRMDWVLWSFCWLLSSAYMNHRSGRQKVVRVQVAVKSSRANTLPCGNPLGRATSTFTCAKRTRDVTRPQCNSSYCPILFDNLSGEPYTSAGALDIRTNTAGYSVEMYFGSLNLSRVCGSQFTNGVHGFLKNE